MQILQGIPVSPGVAVGEAMVIDHEGFRIPRRFVMRDSVETELERLNKAVEAVGVEIERDRQTIAGQLGDRYGAIFSAHLEMLHDPGLQKQLIELIQDKHYSPEYAVSRTLRKYAKAFEQLDSSLLAERAHDIFDLEKNLLRQLLGRRREDLTHLVSPVVVLAHNLTPSETARLDRQFVLAFVTEIGGPSSHTAIVAKGLEIPAVVGTGSFLTDVSGGDVVIVDGDHGRVILQPDEETVARYRHEEEEHRTLQIQLGELNELPAETVDGQRISLMANIEFPHEVDACSERGADGIGLYRTEFLYLEAETEPTEEDHYAAYVQVVQAMKGLPVVIRTLDLGADKLGQLPLDEEEANPFLGLRSIRLSLRNLPAFRVQLRAILRASVLGDVRMMFPLVTTLKELRQAKMVLADTMEDLDEQQIPFNREIAVGMMVEVPAAVIMLDKFINEVDFVSIGTNDLTQYVLAVDRSNKKVADLYHAGDPAVLRLIDQTIKTAQNGGVAVSVCGEMSGTTSYAMLLMGLGLRGLSVAPSSIPEVKKICRSVTISKCEEVAQRALTMDSAQEINAYLHDELKKIVPELVPD